MLFEYVCNLTTTTTTTFKIVLVLMTKVAKCVYSGHPIHFFIHSFLMFIDILTSSSHVLIQLFRGTLVFLY